MTTSETGCTFTEAELNHLRDALALSHAQRWAWLREAMDFGFAVARKRAEQGLSSLGPHGELFWSPESEARLRKGVAAAASTAGRTEQR